jgi:arylsulfatase
MNVFLNIKNRSLTISADLEIPQGGADGVILAQGGRVGGFSLYFKGGKPIYTYNFLGMQRFTVAAAQAVPAGKATVRFEFAYDGGGLGKGGLGTIYVDDAMPVTEDYKIFDNEFTGKIHRVTIDVKEMGAGTRAEAAKAGGEAAAKKAAVTN